MLDRDGFDPSTIDLLGAVMAAFVTGMLDWLLAAWGTTSGRCRGEAVKETPDGRSGCSGIGRAMSFSER
jgi:hypothetical protein